MIDFQAMIRISSALTRMLLSILMPIQNQHCQTLGGWIHYFAESLELEVQVSANHSITAPILVT